MFNITEHREFKGLLIALREKMRIFLLTFCLIGLCFSTLAQSITFGTEATYAPFEYYDKDNQLVGFDIDIAQKICEIAQFECKFTNQAFDSLIPSLKTRRIDAAISGIDITPERKQQILFSQPYYHNSAAFLSQENAFSSIQELKGKRVGVQNGTTYQKYLLEQFPEIKIINYATYQYAILDLKSRRIDAIFSDRALADEWIKNDKNLSVVGNNVVDSNYFGSGLGIATHKGNHQLVNIFNQALRQMQTDGSYQQIYDKWFTNP